MSVVGADREKHKQMILNPDRWPHLILPLKRSNPFEPGNTAVFAPPMNPRVISENAPIEILIGTMFDILPTLPRKQYENVDALLDDGWVVD